MNKILHVIGTDILWKCDQDGPQTSHDRGYTWQFTFRGEAEFREMFQDFQIEEVKNKVDGPKITR